MEEEAKKKTEVLAHRLNPAKACKSPRLDVFTEEYLEWVKTNKKPSTYQRIASAMVRLTAFFSRKKLSDLTSWHLGQ